MWKTGFLYYWIIIIQFSIINAELKLDFASRLTESTEIKYFEKMSRDIYLDTLISLCESYSQTMFVSMGYSTHNRAIIGLYIAGINPDPTKQNKVIYINTGLRGAESSLSLIVLNYIHSLLEIFDEDSVYRQGIDYFIVPFANPDAYVETNEYAKAIVSNPYCKGVDIDQNYDFKFQYAPDDIDPCWEENRFDFPFQSNEARTTRFYLSRFANRTLAYLNLIGYGNNKIVFPWAHDTEKQTENWNQLNRIAAHCAAEHFGEYEIHFEYGKSRDVNYPEGGKEIDFVLHHGVPFVFEIQFKRALHHKQYILRGRHLLMCMIRQIIAESAYITSLGPSHSIMTGSEDQPKYEPNIGPIIDHTPEDDSALATDNEDSDSEPETFTSAPDTETPDDPSDEE